MIVVRGRGAHVSSAPSVPCRFHNATLHSTVIIRHKICISPVYIIGCACDILSWIICTPQSCLMSGFYDDLISIVTFSVSKINFLLFNIFKNISKQPQETLKNHYRESLSLSNTLISRLINFTGCFWSKHRRQTLGIVLPSKTNQLYSIAKCIKLMFGKQCSNRVSKFCRQTNNVDIVPRSASYSSGSRDLGYHIVSKVKFSCIML